MKIDAKLMICDRCGNQLILKQNPETHEYEEAKGWYVVNGADICKSCTVEFKSFMTYENQCKLDDLKDV